MRWTRVLELQRSLEILSTVPHPIRLLPDEALTWFLERAAYSSTIGNSVDLQRPPLGLLEQMYKRSFDVILATLGLIVLMPVFVATACAIAYESGLPIFFLQWRGGYNHRRFRIWKFRTMNVTEDSSVVTQATRNDPRVTSVGRVLRKYSIDELPQLLNVITGDMSLVGPRPHALAHDRAYSQLIARYAARYNMKPGVTGWAQINGLRGETANPEVMRRRVEMDLWYIKNWAPWLDVKILAATVRAIANPSNHAF